MKLLPRIFRSKFNRRRLHVLRGMDTRLNTELSALRTAEPSASGMAGTLDAVRLTPPSHFDRKPVSRKRLLPRLCLGSLFVLAGTLAVYWTFIERAPQGYGTQGDLNSYANAYNTYSALSQTVNLDKIELLPHFDTAGNWEATVRYSSVSERVPLSPQRTLQLMDAILKRNAKALQETRKVLNMTYVDRCRWEFFPPIEDLARFKKFWSLFMLEIDAARERKDDKQAMLSALDALQFATQLQCNTSLVPKMTVLNWEIALRDVLWDTLPKLDALTLKQVVSHMDAILTLSEHSYVYQTLINERIRGRNELLDVFSKPHWRWQAAVSHASPGASFPAVLWNFLEGCRYSKGQIITNFDGMMTQEIEWSRKSYSETQGKMFQPPVIDPVIGYFVPVYAGTMFYDTVSRTENQLLITSAALYLCKAEKGEYPKTLLELKDRERNFDYHRYTDPFAIRDSNPFPPLHYRRKQNDFVLYSVGTDGKDNGGTPIHNKQLAPGNSLYYAVRADAAGDIVAGLNRSGQ